jgi:hypothetical protein
VYGEFAELLEKGAISAVVEVTNPLNQYER